VKQQTIFDSRTADEIEDDLTERISYHEAGHVVAAALLCAPIGAASSVKGHAFSSSGNAEAIRDEWSRRGLTKYLNLTPEEAVCVIALAGICAEVQFFPNIDLRTYNASDADFALVYRITRGNEEWAQSLTEYTRACMSQFSDIVDVIASVLQCQMYLPGTTLDALCELLLANRGRGTLH
jgi:hypothetical protein